MEFMVAGWGRYGGEPRMIEHTRIVHLRAFVEDSPGLR